AFGRLEFRQPAASQGLYRPRPDRRLDDHSSLLRWGGWNECPAAEYHVAAMRSWRDRYGAELVGMSSGMLNFRVTAKPKTREEALALAREQYIYCADLIDQGVQTYSALAADLMANDWWYFWWD